MLFSVRPTSIEQIRRMCKFRALPLTLPFRDMIHGKRLIHVHSIRCEFEFRGSPSNGNITRNDHDLVLLKLQQRARYTDLVRAIRLPNPLNDKRNPAKQQQCIVSGFGIIKDTRQSYILKYLPVPIVDRDEWYFKGDLYDLLRPSRTS